MGELPDDLLALLGTPPPPETRNAAPAGPRNGVAIEKEAGQPQDQLYDLLSILLGPVSPLDRPLTWTRFTGAGSRTAERRTASLRELADLIQSTRAPEKSRLPWLKLASFGDHATDKGALRHDANLVAVHGIEGDYDAGALSVDDAAARLNDAGLAALVYTTPSHTAAVPRWRVLCPTSADIAPGDRDALCERLNGALGGILAPESFTRSQAYYFGGVGAEPETRLVEGRPIDLATELPRIGRRGAADVVEPDLDDGDDLAAFITPDWTRINAALAFVPSDDRDDWLTVGMALHAESGGSGEGFDVWTKWSKGSGKYAARDQRRTWESFGETGRKAVGVGTLYKLAQDHGGDAKAIPCGDVDRLNKRHAVVAVRGRTLITTERDDGTIDFGTPRDLHAYYENDRVEVNDKKTEPVSSRWMRHVLRRTYPDGVTFAPGGCDAGTLNLWRGWAVEPDAGGSCALFLDHVRRVVCRGNGDHAAYVLGWLAHMVQRPGEKPGVGLVLRGGKGAGKDTVADYLARMIGKRHVPTVAESDHVTGKFNARLEAALLLHVQEGTWAGDRRAEGNLKYMVTSDRIEIERKGIDSINVPSVLRLFISANAEWVVPASADERRWAVFEVSDDRRGDAAYFTALRTEMNGRGPAALLYFLRAYDLSGFNVRAAPDTEGLRDQKLATLKNMGAWWFETLSRGDLPTCGMDDGDWPTSIGRDALRLSYVEWMKGRRFEGELAGDRHFGRLLRQMLPALDDRRPKVGACRVRQYVIPELADCRAAFDAWIGSPVDWEAVS